MPIQGWENSALPTIADMDLACTNHIGDCLCGKCPAGYFTNTFFVSVRPSALTFTMPIPLGAVSCASPPMTFWESIRCHVLVCQRIYGRRRRRVTWSMSAWFTWKFMFSFSGRNWMVMVCRPGVRRASTVLVYPQSFQFPTPR